MKKIRTLRRPLRAKVFLTHLAHRRHSSLWSQVCLLGFAPVHFAHIPPSFLLPTLCIHVGAAECLR